MNGMNFAFQIGDGHEIPEPPKGFLKDCGPFEEPPPFGDAEQEEEVTKKENAINAIKIKYIFK
jgi:hypothetical protein